MEWMLDIQLGRRNLTPIQKIAITEKYRPIYEKQAKKNKQNAMMIARQNNENNKNEQFSQISSTTVDSKNKIDVRAKLAETAGVSTDTYSKGKKILNSNNEKLKQEVLSGEKSINAGYKELTGKKVGKRIKELERLYGIREGSAGGNGSNQYIKKELEPNSSVEAKKSQCDLAAQMGISVDTLQNYKLLSEMIPELSDLVDTGIFLVFILR